MVKAPKLHRIAPGSKVDLDDHDPADTSAGPGDKETTQITIFSMAERLADLQNRLWARNDQSVLVVLQGIDSSGKGGTVKRVFGAVNPAGLRVTSFKAPSTSEQERDYLWRVHQKVPANGEIGVFDRSHYEDVLAVRVMGLAPEKVWRRRFDHINAFEELLVDEGTTVVKLLLHISKTEQAKRLQARLDDPAKHWKFRTSDLDARAQWEDYQEAFVDVLERTSTEKAPWYVIPADKKWYRDWAVATIMIETLEGLDLSWPDFTDPVDGVVIE